MKFTLSWLKKFLHTDATLPQIVDTLNEIGFEVEEVIDRSHELSSFKVAEIIEATPHPNADKLRVCKVQSEDAILQIVCGAPNARSGIKVILAKVGASIPNGNFQIKSSEIRGVLSNGMLCSETELLIGNDQNGIAELPKDAVVGEEFSKYYGLDDPVIEIAITPNRGDCLGVYYIAKELAARNLGTLVNLVENNEETYPTFATLKISGIKNRQSPEWLQSLLKNIGQAPISAIVDITNYMCHTYARPMHAYDASKISGKLIVDFAKEGESFTALNGKEYKLSSEDLIIRDDKVVRALAGIIGGANSGCELDTNTIILESAIFDPISVSKSGRRHKIETDSRYRFERNIDPLMIAPALKIAAQMIVEICGGKIEELDHAKTNQISRNIIKCDIGVIKRVIGIELSQDKVLDILKKLHCESSIENNVITVVAPTFRHDLNIPEDIAEEIIRIHGYENIPTTPLPISYVSRVLTNTQRRNMEVRRILASQGYQELITWSFMDPNDAVKFYDLRDKHFLANPISNDLCYMRESIIPNLLIALSKNLSRSIDNMAFFEVGPAFNDAENNNIVGVKIGSADHKNLHNRERTIDIFDIKRDVSLILSEVGYKIDKFLLDKAPKYYHPFVSAALKLGKNHIGYFGAIHPEILEHYDIKVPVMAFELNLDAIPESKPKYGRKGAYSISDYQAVNRDFAFVLDIDQPAGDLGISIQNIDKKLIKEVTLFDVYVGDKVALGKKSLAFNVLLQANDRTLKEEEINTLCKEIIDNICTKYNATLRT